MLFSKYGCHNTRVTRPLPLSPPPPAVHPEALLHNIGYATRYSTLNVHAILSTTTQREKHTNETAGAPSSCSTSLAPQCLAWGIGGNGKLRRQRGARPSAPEDHCQLLLLLLLLLAPQPPEPQPFQSCDAHSMVGWSPASPAPRQWRSLSEQLRTQAGHAEGAGRAGPHPNPCPASRQTYR